MLYLAIFTFKIIEDALATLRLIVVSNGKKILGAILQFIVTLIWIILTGSVLINLQKDLYKALAFALGSLFGSYLGSVLEEKIALGTNMFMVEISKEKGKRLIQILKNQKFQVTKINGNQQTFLIITSPRKKTKDVIKTINEIDKNAIIVSEKIKIFASHI
jgi:uncharacterized protein YebE (UPF0316 family)